MSTFVENNLGSGHADYEDLFEFLDRYNQFSIIDWTSRNLREILNRNDVGNPDININSLSLIMLTLLDPHFNTSPTKPYITNKEFRDANLLANAASDFSIDDPNDRAIWYIQTHYNQIVLNPISPYYKILLYIFIFCGTGELQNDTLSNYFQEVFHMAPQTMGVALWVIFSFFENNTRLKNLEQCGLKDIDSLQQTLLLFSCSLREIRHRFSTLPKYECKHWTGRFNPFRDYPIVVENIAGENHYWVPVPHFLYLLHTDNLYYRLFSYYLEKENHGTNEFAATFGKVIEDLAYKFTEHEIGENRQVFPEFPLASKSHGGMAADIHIVENKLKQLCMVQIKAKRVRLSSQGGNLQCYFEDIQKSLLAEVEQNYKLLSNPAFQQALATKTAWKFDLTKITFLIIFMEGFYDIEYPDIRQFVDEEIESLRQKYSITTAIPIAFVSLEHYLRLIEWSAQTKRSVSDKIRDYNKYLKEPAKERNLGASGLPHTFDEYIRIKTIGQNFDRSLCKKVYDQYFQRINEQILSQP